MPSGNYFKGFAALALLCTISQTAVAQSSKPYTLDDVIEFVKGDVTTASILSRVRGACINFKVTESVATRLTGQGASDSLIEGLRSVCYKGSSKEIDTPPVQPRVTPRRTVNPPPAPKVETVFVQRPVTPPPVVRPTVVPPPPPPTVYTPPVSNTTGSSIVDWDFRSSQPLTSGRFGKCQYDYSSSGYTISVAENGSPCLDGAPNELESNVRISTTATPIRGTEGYNYGIRFGVSDDSTVGYYALEVSTLGHYQLSRFRNKQWEVIFPWKTGSGINTTSTNRISVEIRGSQVKFIINGIEQYTYQAPGPITGRAGFGIFGYGDDAPFPVVTFATFSETSLSAPTTTTTASNFVDWDFRTSQPLTSGRFGKCQYDYSSAGYTISVAENGTTCIDGPLGDQPASVRISTTALPIHGTSGYTYGLRIGYTTDSTVGYYAFEISEGGSFQLSRYRMKQWEPLIPWQRLPNIINPASSNSYNTMTADVRGNSLTLFINGSQVGTYQTPYPVVGPAGFGIIGYSAGDPLPMVTFTRFSIQPE